MKRVLLLVISAMLFGCNEASTTDNIVTLTPEDSTARYERLASLPWDTLFKIENAFGLGPNMDSSIITLDSAKAQPDGLSRIFWHAGLDVYGSKEQAKETTVFFEYYPETHPDQYPAELYDGPLAVPNFRTYPEMRRYITRITETCDTTGVNFGGKYTMVIWGCGSSCQSSVIVDRITGEILDAPFSSSGRSFQPGSMMVIINNGFVDSANHRSPLQATGLVEHWVLEDKEFQEVENFYEL